MLQNELCHYGVPGMKWRQRKTRYSDGSLTRYGAKKLSKELNKETKSKDYVAIQYRDKGRKKNNMVYQLNKQDKAYIKGKAKVNSILAGPIGGVMITNHQFNKKMYNKFSNPNGIGPNYGNKPVTYTTIVKNKNK